MAVDDKGPPLKLNIATEKCSYIPSRRYIVGTLNFRGEFDLGNFDGDFHTSWWFQPIWKILLVKLDDLPR